MGLIPGESNLPFEVESLRRLTRRETEVFILMTKLRSTVEMAFELGLKEKGVKHHINMIYKKLEIDVDSLGSASKRLVFLRTYTNCILKSWVKL